MGLGDDFEARARCAGCGMPDTSGALFQVMGLEGLRCGSCLARELETERELLASTIRLKDQIAAHQRLRPEDAAVRNQGERRGKTMMEEPKQGQKFRKKPYTSSLYECLGTATPGGYQNIGRLVVYRAEESEALFYRPVKDFAAQFKPVKPEDASVKPEGTVAASEGTVDVVAAAGIRAPAPEILRRETQRLAEAMLQEEAARALAGTVVRFDPDGRLTRDEKIRLECLVKGLWSRLRDENAAFRALDLVPMCAQGAVGTRILHVWLAKRKPESPTDIAALRTLARELAEALELAHAREMGVAEPAL